MAYCKHCGMESADPSHCEWCGRPILRLAEAPAQAAVEAPKETEEARAASPTDYFVYGGVLIPIRSTAGQDERMAYVPEEAWGSAFLDFSVYCLTLLFLGSSLIAWHFSLYLLAMISMAFTVGILLTKLRIIRPFDEEAWEDEYGMSIMLLLVLFVPAILVYIGYIVYGRQTQRMDHTVVRLMTPALVAVVVLLALRMLAGPDTVPMAAYWEFRGVEFLSLAGVLTGWLVSGFLESSTGSSLT